MRVGGVGHIAGVEPRNPVDGAVGGHAIHAVVHESETLAHQFVHLHQFEAVGLGDVGHLGDGVIKPYGLAIDFAESLVGPHLDADGRGDQVLPDVIIHTGFVAVVSHLHEIVIAGDNHFIIA